MTSGENHSKQRAQHVQRPCVLVSSGCRNKILQSGELKQQEFIVLIDLEVGKPKFKAPTSLVPDESYLPGSQTAPFC